MGKIDEMKKKGILNDNFFEKSNPKRKDEEKEEVKDVDLKGMEYYLDKYLPSLEKQKE